VVRRLGLAVAAAALLSAFTCSKRAAVDMPDKEVPPPSLKQLEAWQREYDAGTTWRGDPLRLAHEEIKNWLDVPWKGEPFNPDRYEFTENNPEKPQWGSYVVRRYMDENGRMVSYQVQMSRRGSIWYARKVRHYFSIDVAHPRLQDKDKRRH
jgi:hypothetical protein